jgi:hypothetical protein
MLEIIVAAILALLLIGVLPDWDYSRGWGYGPSGLVMVLLIILIVVVLTGRAHAQSGVSPWAKKCGELYAVRNQFYNRRGLCFTRESAKELFPENELTCRYDRAIDVPVSKREEAAINQIVAMERSLGCPRI